MIVSSPLCKKNKLELYSFSISVFSTFNNISHYFIVCLFVLTGSLPVSYTTIQHNQDKSPITD